MARRRSARLQEAQDKTSTGIKRDQANTQLQDLEANIPSTKKVNVSRDDQVGGLVVGPPDRAGGDTRLDEEDESIDANDKGFLNDMPPEIFQEVTAYLGPDDILCLARLNRVLRNLLMSKSARFIWRTSFQNFLPSIPPLPADLNELQYAELIFGTGCSICPNESSGLVYLWACRIRCCGDCLKSKFTDLSGLSPVSETFEKLISCVPSYMIFDEIIHQYKYVYAIGWTLELYKEYRELSQDRKNAWLKEKRDVLQNLYEHERACIQWRDAWLTQREVEENCQRRRSEIFRRLVERGWEDLDLKEYHITNHKLVNIPEPLTEEIWRKICPALEEELKCHSASR